MELNRLANFFLDRVEAARRELALRVDLARYREALLPNLFERLFELSHKVLLAQFKLVEARLNFDDYCESLREPEVRAYLAQRFPVLHDWLDQVCAGWVTQSALFVQRFEQDLPLLQAQFFPGQAAPVLKSLHCGLGDAHRGGATVALLQFEDGRRLLYKPRSLAMDTHFGAIAAWLAQATGLVLRLPQHLDRGSHGWVEFIAHTECADAVEVEQFYEHLGALLGLLYLLEGNDFHYENIIAAGAHPVPIDLESFFHPVSPIVGTETNEAIDHSVLKTGILPVRNGASGEYFPEVSALSDVEGQAGLSRMMLGRDEDGRLVFLRGRGELRGAQNLPRLHGRSLPLGPAHAAQLQRGFRRVYEAALADGAGLAALVEACAAAEVRVIFRHTATYAHLLEEARHPLLMTSREALARHFDLLRLVIADFPVAGRFVGLEIADLERYDVPLFTARVDGRDLCAGAGLRVDDFFVKSGLQAAREKLAALSPQDLEHQLWLIANSLSLRSQLGRPDALTGAGEGATALPLRERLRAEARRIGKLVCDRLHVDGEHASWLVYKTKSLDGSQIELAQAFYDLHGGMPGEILLFDQLARLDGSGEHALLARKALNFLLHRIERSRDSVKPLGLFAGWGSVIHLFTTLGLQDAAAGHFERVEDLFARTDFPALIALDGNQGLYKGTAGFVFACAAHHLASGSPRALQLAVHAAEQLLQRRAAEHAGYAWRISSDLPLSGLSHGASGFAVAFAALYRASGEARWHEAALQALAYERTLYVPAARNWRDCRRIVIEEHGEQRYCSTAWSHGAPGIGLARLALLDAGIATADIRAELEIALETTLARGFGAGHSLTYGAFGSLELPLAYAERFGADARFDSAALAGGLLDSIAREGWRLDAQGSLPLGLMVGVTGIAYQCLRAAAPEQVPALLSLRLPPAAAAAVRRSA